MGALISCEIPSWRQFRVTEDGDYVNMIDSLALSSPCDNPGPTRRSFWVIPGRFAAGAYPGKRERGGVLYVEVLEELLTAGIDSFINLTEDRPGGTDSHLNRYDEAVFGRGVVERYEIPDVDIPTEPNMVEILDAVDLSLDEGRNPYVHCWGGIGRTGTVIGCWLIRHGYASAADAIAVLAQLRRGDVGGGARLAPETIAQRRFVEAWECGR